MYEMINFLHWKKPKLNVVVKIKIKVSAFGSGGNLINYCLCGSYGMESCNFCKSMILYHNNSPL